MDNLADFAGPFPFDAETIRGVVTKTVSPGNYLLGDTSGDSFRISYVGRSDTSVLRNLEELVQKTGGQLGCQSFQFRYAESSKEAFEVQCALFHKFRQWVMNATHPERPEGSALRCPVCKVLA
jgi:hypothetical protein